MANPSYELYREIFEGAATPTAARGLARLGRALRRLGGAAGDLVYPPHCMACGQPLPAGNGALCVPCASRVPWIGPDRCRRCGDAVGPGRGAVDACPQCSSRPPAFVEASCAVARYREPFRAVILGLKFGAGLQAVPLLGRLLAARLRATGLTEGLPQPPALAPVPMFSADQAARGFNQAEEIARWAARELRLPLETRLLRKVRPTAPQATLSAEARAENLRGAFVARPARARRHAAGGVILVDDVMTTGATVSECARALQGELKRIRVAVVARG